MKILLVDDHPMMRAGLEATLIAAFPGAQILTANAADEAIALVNGRVDLDLVLLDLRIPSLDDGLAVLRAVTALANHPAVVALSAEADAALVASLRAAGARGYVSKSKGPDTLLSALRTVLAGGEFFPAIAAQSGGLPTRGPRPCPNLIPRVWQVYHLVSEGLPNKLIGRSLNITEGAVKNYVTRVLDEVDAMNRGEAISIYKENISRWQLDPLYKKTAPAKI